MMEEQWKTQILSRKRAIECVTQACDSPITLGSVQCWLWHLQTIKWVSTVRQTWDFTQRRINSANDCHWHVFPVIELVSAQWTSRKCMQVLNSKGNISIHSLHSSFGLSLLNLLANYLSHIRNSVWEVFLLIYSLHLNYIHIYFFSNIIVSFAPGRCKLGSHNHALSCSIKANQCRSGRSVFFFFLSRVSYSNLSTRQCHIMNTRWINL